MRILSDLPTEKAMKEISNGRIGPAIQKVIETMALQKMDLIKSLRLMKFREDVLMKMVEVNMEADARSRDWVNQNPNFRVDLVAVENDKTN